MPAATKDKTAPTGKIQTKTVTTVVTDPVEQTLAPPAAPPPEVSEDFWKYIQSLTAEDWKKHTVGLYRYPLGQTKPQKLGRYVKTYKAGCPLVSEDQIFDEFGGSQYDAILRGPHPDGSGRQTLLAKHSWEMDGPAKDPWKNSAAGGAAAPAPSDTAAILDTLLKHLQNLQASKNPAQDPAVKDSIALIQQLTTAMPKPEGVKELIAGLASLQQLTGGNGGGKSQLRETLELLKELGIIGDKDKRKSLAEELKDIMEIAGMMGGGGGGGKTDWGTALVQNLPSILEKVTPIADKFADAARSNARALEVRANIRPMQPAQPAPATPVPAAESPAPRAIAAPETEPATPPQGAEDVQAPNLIWVKARAVQLFGEGKSGDQIAEWLDTLDKGLGDMLGSMDEEKFELFVKSDPILGQISGAPRFPGFVREFVGYFAESDESETGGTEKS